MRRAVLRYCANFSNETAIDFSIGACLVPVGYSICLVWQRGLPVLEVLLATGFVACITALVSGRRCPGDFSWSAIFAPVAAILAAFLLIASQRAALAFVSGTAGVLLGGDFLHVANVRYLGAPSAVIGTADTMDAILLTALLALLAA